MPTEFEPFKFLGLYPPCPQNDYALDWNNQPVYQTSLSDINNGVPFFWLLKSLQMSVSWDLTVTIEDTTFEDEGSDQAIFNFDFLALPPNERICVNHQDGRFATGTKTNESSPLFLDYSLYPFKENNLHAHFAMIETVDIGFATVFDFYISTYEAEPTSGNNRYEWKEISIPSNPYNISGTLYGGIRASIGPEIWSGTWDVQIGEIEFWT